MRNYQMRRSNPGLLPHNVYMQLQYLLKDYDRETPPEKRRSAWPASAGSLLPSRTARRK